MKILYGSCMCLLLACGFAACSTTQQTVAYRTIYSLEQTATAANSAYLDLVIQGKVSTNALPTVTKVFNQVQADIILAAALVQNDTNALAPANLIIEVTDLINVINTAKAAAK